MKITLSAKVIFCRSSPLNLKGDFGSIQKLMSIMLSIYPKIYLRKTISYVPKKGERRNPPDNKTNLSAKSTLPIWHACNILPKMLAHNWYEYQSHDEIFLTHRHLSNENKTYLTLVPRMTSQKEYRIVDLLESVTNPLKLCHSFLLIDIGKFCLKSFSSLKCICHK